METTPQSYIEAWTVCEGALESEETFYDWSSYSEWAERQITEAKAEGVECEVYHIEHDHPEDMDCECVQYLRDHSPYMSTEDSK